MSSAYYVARHRTGSWPGVCEVRDTDPDHYFHHKKWPERNYMPMRFVSPEGSLRACIDPISGWWTQIHYDEDLEMDEGL